MALTNKIVVVLGGGGLLGSECVRACVSEGAHVVSADLKEPPLLPEGVTFIQCDATNEEEVYVLVQKVRQEFGRADVIINATYPKTKNYGKRFEDGDLDEMLENTALHIKTCMTAVRGFLPLFKEQKSGSLVFFGSIYGVAAPRLDIYEGTSMTVPLEYAAAKGGVIAVTRYFASLLGRYGVRVNAISPGGIADNQPQSFVDAYSKHLLLGKGLLSPKHISGAVVFLASDASEMMTGQNLVIDGGWTV